MQWLKKQRHKDKYLQNTTKKTKARATQTPLKIGVNSGAPEG